jgi:hypothetical protein
MHYVGKFAGMCRLRGNCLFQVDVEVQDVETHRRIAAG